MLCWAQPALATNSPHGRVSVARVGLAVATCSHLSLGADSPCVTGCSHLCLQVNWDGVTGRLDPSSTVCSLATKAALPFPCSQRG